MSLFSWLTGANPSVIAANAGQAAVEGIFSGVTELIQTFKLPPGQEAEINLKLSQLKFTAYQNMISDVQSARAMQVSNKSLWPGLLSALTLGGFFALGWYLITHGVPQTSQEGRDILIQWFATLENGVLLVYGFWLGTSYGSKEKTQILDRVVNHKS
jgi:hypothetical protein